MSTIAAISTPHGSGGIAVIRVSGPESVTIVNKIWRGANLLKAGSHTAHLGELVDSDGSALDRAVATLFLSPNSYTGENTVELSVHGSKWIQRQVLYRLMEMGARAAEPGEFTKRAFINGRLDLAQAEAVADVIASSSRAAHKLAMSQMSGGFSRRLNELRDKLIELASLLELELDFSEEDVEFADRSRLREIATETLTLIRSLAATYSSGKAFKEGIPVAIAGRPNAGKSTLLNALLQEDKAIVSDVPGTTRDIIEDTCEIDGVMFRFFDTAGLHDTSDTVEKIGISRAREAISKAAITLWVIDPTDNEIKVSDQIKYISEQYNALNGKNHIIIYNKSDICSLIKNSEQDACITVSARTGNGLDELKKTLVRLSKSEHNPDTELMVTNARHYAAMTAGAESLERACEGIEGGLSADFIAQDIREAIHHLSAVTGEVTTDTLLSSIFSKFCIGK